MRVGHVEGEGGQHVRQAHHQEHREGRAAGDGWRWGECRGGGVGGDHESSTGETGSTGQCQTSHGLPPAPGGDQDLHQGSRESGAHPGCAEDNSGGEGPPAGEVLGGDDHTGQVHQAEPEAGEEAVGEDEGRDTLGEAGEEETGTGEERSQETAGPLPPPLHQSADQGRAEAVHSHLQAPGHGQHSSPLAQLLQERREEDPEGVSDPVQDTDAEEAGGHHQPAVPTLAILAPSSRGQQTLLLSLLTHLQIILYLTYQSWKRSRCALKSQCCQDIVLIVSITTRDSC